MSKYKYEFGVSVGASVTQETVDLIDDWGYAEKELDAMSDRVLELLISELADEFVANEVDSWVKPVDGSREV